MIGVGSVYICATADEIGEYSRDKFIARQEALVDGSKQTPMVAKAVVTVGKLTVGMCPVCGHCVSKFQTDCDECFQVLDWNK